jgi:nitroreductase
MDVIEAIKNRRSIRSFKSDPISDEDINLVLEAARWAPSWANTQCWEFIVIRDQNTKEKLASTLSRGNPAREAMVKAPVVIAACGRLKKSGFYKGKAVTEKGDWVMFDVALASQNLTLAACERGLGSLHVGALDFKKAAQILEIPDDLTLVELILLGYPQKVPSAPPRKELAEFVHYERYSR